MVTVSVLLLLLACRHVLAVDHDAQEKQGAMKKRLWLQSTGEVLQRDVSLCTGALIAGRVARTVISPDKGWN